MQPSNVVTMKDALPSDAAARQRLHQLLDAYLDADLAILLTRIRETEGAGSFTKPFAPGSPSTPLGNGRNGAKNAVFKKSFL